jgi:hypothetical protein
MRTIPAILILIANLWNLAPFTTPLQALFDRDEDLGGVTAQQDPPDDGRVIIIPPPR